MARCHQPDHFGERYHEVAWKKPKLRHTERSGCIPRRSPQGVDSSMTSIEYGGSFDLIDEPSIFASPSMKP